MEKRWLLGLGVSLLAGCNSLAQVNDPQKVVAPQPVQSSPTADRPAPTPPAAIAPQFDSAADFSGGLALVGFSETYGFINSTGKSGGETKPGN